MNLNGGNKKKEKNKSAAPRKAKKSKGFTKAKISILIVAIIAAVLFAAAAAGVIYVGSIDEIYPNVTLDGLNLGGMSLTEAAAKLDEHGYSSQAGKEVNVYLPLDLVLNVQAEDVCSETPIADLVQRVYEACAGGNPIEDALSYVKCRFGGMALQSEILITVDETAVAAKVDNIVRELNLELMGSDVSIGEESILVTKGASSVTIDAAEVTALVVEAFQNEDYSDITVEGTINTDEELDVEKLHETVFCEPADAYYDEDAGEIVEHVVGMDFDAEEAEGLWAAAVYGEKVEIPLILTEPEVTTGYLEEILFRDCLSSSKTSLWGSSYGRINNVRKAAEAVDGMILMPGEEFSYNEALGERTAANGYMEAGAYSDGETVQEYGGGICQVSSMMYYCALYANLDITYRYYHYFPVSYVPPGLDATVSWGGPEFKFVNDRDFPIKIVAYVEDDNTDVVVEFWGSDIDGSYVEMTYTTWLVYDEEYEDVAIGYKAQTYRSVYNADGSLISQNKEALSFYNYHEEDIEWPEESPEPTPTPETAPTPEATEEPSPDVSGEPAPEESSEPTEEPVETETPETTQEPAPEETAEPTPEPTEPVGEEEE